MNVWVNGEWIYSRRLVLWWLPHHLQDQVLSSYTEQQAYNDLALLRSPSDLPHMRNRHFMLQQRGASWQSQSAQPCPRLSDLVLHAVTKAVWRRPSSSYWVEKCSQTEGSLLPQCSCGASALSASGLHTVVQAKPFDRELVDGRA